MKPLSAIRTASALSLVLILAGVTASFGGPGGKVVPTGSEACSVTPNPVDNGQQYFVNGTGFKPGQVLNITVGSGTTLMTAADVNGAFSAWNWAVFSYAGVKDVKVYQQADRKHTVLASCSFMANGPTN